MSLFLPDITEKVLGEHSRAFPVLFDKANQQLQQVILCHDIPLRVGSLCGESGLPLWGEWAPSV